jgi:hypothetical protein
MINNDNISMRRIKETKEQAQGYSIRKGEVFFPS